MSRRRLGGGLGMLRGGRVSVGMQVVCAFVPRVGGVAAGAEVAAAVRSEEPVLRVLQRLACRSLLNRD